MFIYKSVLQDITNRISLSLFTQYTTYVAVKSKIVPKFSLQILKSTLYYNTNCNYSVYCFVFICNSIVIFIVCFYSFFGFVFTEFMVLFLLCLNKRKLFNESYCIPLQCSGYQKFSFSNACLKYDTKQLRSGRDRL